MKQQQNQPAAAEEEDNTGENEMLVFDIGSLCEVFCQIKDGRKARGRRYSLTLMLLLMMLAKLSGEDTPEAMADWAKQRADGLSELLKLKRKCTPDATTYSRVLRKAVPSEAFERAVHDLLERHPRIAAHPQRCIDGKQIRGTQVEGKDGNVYLLGAFVPGAGVMLYQIEIASGQGELTVTPQMLKVLDLQGKVVSGDAGFAQRNLSVQIVAQNGHYLWQVKSNQPQLLEQIKQVFDIPEAARTAKSHTQHTCGHGRVEARTLTVSSMLKGFSDWPHLSQVFKITCVSRHKKTGLVTHTHRYGVTSLSAREASPKRLLDHVRAHWQIESQAHYRRDVTFHEDFCDLRLGQAARVMAILNNLANTIISLSGAKNAAHARRVFDAHPHTALAALTNRL